jgi:hypothetical protein
MRRLFSLRGTLAAGFWIGCVSAALWAQDAETPDASSSLGDLARQTRSQHAADEGKSSKAQQLVDEMQQEQEASENAPLGFKNYDAGDYRLFVPFPFSLEGRDNGGAVLLGSRIGVTNTEVMAGSPIPIPPNASDDYLMNMVRQNAGLHGPSPYCAVNKQGDRRVFRCSWNGAPNLLGRPVLGSMEFVVASSSLIPVMCVSPDEKECLGYDRTGYHTCNNRNPSWEEVQRTKAAIQAHAGDARTTWQSCDQIIYPSIQLKEDIVVHPVKFSEEKPARVAAAVAQDTSVAADPQSTPLADLARQTRQAPRGGPQAALDSAEGPVAPAGFQFFELQYCQNPQHCSDASVVIPEKAEVVSRTNGQYIFKSLLNGATIMLYAGPADVNAPYRGMTDPDYIRMRDLANSNGWSHEKTDGVSTQELTIEGRSALMTRFRYQRDAKTWWVGERLLIDMQGSQFLVGCTAPEQGFADAEVLCTTLVNSLRLK